MGARAVDELATISASDLQEDQPTFRAYGAIERLIYSPNTEEVLLDGPAGTGKTFGVLTYFDLVCRLYPGIRGLITRKTRRALTQTAMVTFERKVLWRDCGVKFHKSEGVYRYWNGSEIVVGGIDDPQKVFSSEYDWIYNNEATELQVADYEALLSRLRNNQMPWQRMVSDCNPSSPTHWLKQRVDRGVLARYQSTHRDNPAYWDMERGDWTPLGRQYYARLGNLTGVRLQRLRDGLWVAAEGTIYTEWDPGVHMLNMSDVFVLHPNSDEPIIPHSWPKFRSVDFGYNNAFVCQWWAVGPDGTLYRYRELYGRERLYSDWARDILDLTPPDEEASIITTITDHDAEGRATLEAAGIRTTIADKRVQVGIQAVKGRMRTRPNGRPRLVLMRGALVARDAALDDAGRPCCTEEEVESYVWKPARDGSSRTEEPVKVDDHGLDAMRYMVMYLDGDDEELASTVSLDAGLAQRIAGFTGI